MTNEHMTNDSEALRPLPRIGVLGLGVMGLPMARNILGAALEGNGTVNLSGRRRDRASTLIEAGATWRESPRQVAENSDLVLLMLPDLPQVEEVLAGPDGLLAGVTSPLLLAIGSTSSPDGVRDLAERLATISDGLVSVIDTPVSGGEDGAIAGTLSIMVGGDPAHFEFARPVLEAAGNPVLLGPLGSGQVAKACNQMIVAATVLALGEASVIAERSGLDVRALLTLLSGGYAGSRVLETRLDRFANRDYSPSGVAKYMVKDLSFAKAEAEKSGTVAKQLEVLFEQFTALTEEGFGDQDIAVTRAFVESHRTS